MRDFRAPLLAWVVTGAGVALFLGLSVWQFQRGQAKERWLAQFDDGSAPIMTLSPALSAPPPRALQRARAVGRYDGTRQLLQDGQSRGGRPGYHVWTVLRLAGGVIALVNRGWIPQPFNPEKDNLAAPEGEITVTGWWRDLPEPGIRLDAGECRKPAAFPAVVVYPRLEHLVCVLGEPVLPGLLLLDPLEPGGFVREWAVASLPPERHYGYAVTWFALGVTAVILFVTLNLKPKTQ